MASFLGRIPNLDPWPGQPSAQQDFCIAQGAVLTPACGVAPANDPTGGRERGESTRSALQKEHLKGNWMKEGSPASRSKKL